MQRILLLTVCSLSINSAFSQLARGSFLMGGSASYQYVETSYGGGVTKNRVLDLHPNIGYFIMNRLAAGLRTNLTTSKSTQYGGEVFRHRSLSVAPFMRYYFLPGIQQLNLFADASYTFSKQVMDVNTEVIQSIKAIQ